MAYPTEAEILASLSYPAQWPSTSVTFSIPVTGSVWPGYGQEPSDPNYRVLTADEAFQFRRAIAEWDRVSGVTLTETNDLSNPGDIRVAVSNLQPGISGQAHIPPGTARIDPTNGDVWADDGANLTSPTLFIHELGHALGLKHPNDAGTLLTTEYQTQRYSFMGTYIPDSTVYGFSFSSDGTTAQATSTQITPKGPMVFDILAMQSKYGPDLSTGAGDTSYRFDEKNGFFSTITDASGVDTIDLSDHHRSSIIDLTPGQYSSIDYFSALEQAAFWKTQLPWLTSAWLEDFFGGAAVYTWTNNLGIAFGTTIENAMGGSGGDRIIGNAVANQLYGNAGNDTLDGGEGNDFLRGGEGDDSIVGGAGFDDTHGNQGNDIVRGGDGPDWVVGGQGDDMLYGDAEGDVVYGNLGNDTQFGGDGIDWVRGGQGNDSLDGGAGDDWMSGDRGDDTISGGAGSDLFNTFGDAGIDRVLDFNRAEGDRVKVEPGFTYTTAQVWADTVISITGGAQMVLVNVQLSSLTGDWLFVG
jgi:serralysin